MSEPRPVLHNMSAPPRTQVTLRPLRPATAEAATGAYDAQGAARATHGTRWCVIDLAQRIEQFRAASHAGDPLGFARGVLALMAKPRSTRAARARYASLLHLDARALSEALERELAAVPLPPGTPAVALVRKLVPDGAPPLEPGVACPRAAARLLAGVSGRVFSARAGISLAELLPATAPARRGQAPAPAPVPVWEFWIPAVPPARPRLP